MNTQLALMAVHEKVDIPVRDICEQYLGISEKEAKRKALRQELPFPVFRAPGKTATWLVNVRDLAEFIDQTRERAKQDWDAMNAA